MKTTYIHKQATPSVEWRVNHNLNALPVSDVSVLVDGKLVKIQPKSVEYVDPFNSIVRFTNAAAGEAMFAGAFARAFAVDLPESELPPVEPSTPTFETKRTTDLLMRLNQPVDTPLADLANNKTYPSPFIPPKARRTSELAKFGAASVYMPGVRGAALSTNSPAALGAHTFPGDYTIEMFFYPTVTTQNAWLFAIGVGTNITWGSQGVLMTPAGDLQLYLTSSTTGNNAANFTPTTGVKVVPNQWNHVAVTRAGNVYSVYLNGARGLTLTHAAAPATPTTHVSIGNSNEYTQGSFPQGSFQGYVDNYRVTKGVARYTGTVGTVPTADFGTTVAADPSWNSVSLLLNMETGTTVANDVAKTVGTITDPFHSIVYDIYANPGSSTIVTSTGGGRFTGGWKPGGTFTDGNGWRSTGGYFNVTEDYLAPGLKDFTWELWYKHVAAHASFQSLIDTRQQATADPMGLALGQNNGQLYVFSNGFLISNTTATALATGWNHIALVRKSGVFSLYRNGVNVGTYVGERNLTNSTVAFASNYSGAARLHDPDAMLSDVRISNVAQYTGNFAVPTAQPEVTTVQVPLAPTIAYSTFDKASAQAGTAVSEDGRTATTASATTLGVRSDVGVTSGKYYFELKIIPGSVSPVFGVGTSVSHTGTNSAHPNSVTYKGGRMWIGDAVQPTGYAFKDNDVIGVALDRDANSVTFFANGAQVASGSLPGTATGKIYAIVRDNILSGSSSFTANFGQEPFAHPVPTGFTAGLPVTEKAWTPVWKAQSNSYNQATGYNWDGAAAVAAVASATEAAIAIYDSTAGTFSPTNMFSFPMPAKWKTQHPFNYTMEDLNVVATEVLTGAQTNGMLRYGSNTFNSTLADAWSPNPAFGRIGITNTTAPYFNGFSSAAGDYLPLSNQAYDAAPVSNTRRFVILVR